MRLLFADFESYHDRKAGMDLRALSIVEYVRHPSFKCHGLGYAFDQEPPKWVPGAEIDGWVRSLDWTDIVLVNHNSKFDSFIFGEVFGAWASQFRDSRSMAKAVLGKTVKGFSLRELAEHFGLEAKGQLKTDGIRDLSPELEKELSEYCLHDVELCRQIYYLLEPQFPKSQYGVMDWTIRTFVRPQLRLNAEKLDIAAKEEAERRRRIFDEIGIPKETFSSNQKFACLLNERGYDVPTKTSPRTGLAIPALALGDVSFNDLAATENSELKALCEARIAAKSTLLETRSAKLARIGKTGAWPFDVEFSGATQTHRFSGGSGAGGNPQNFTACRDKKGHAAGHNCPGILRTCVEAPEGYRIIVGDFSNIEMRLVAYLSKDPGLVQGIETGKDLYCDFASAFYGRLIMKENTAERRFGKTAMLGLQYGMGAKKFRNTVRLQTGQDISKEDAERAVNLYRRRYYRVPKLWDKLQSFIPKMAAGESVRTDLPVVVDKCALILPSGLKIRYSNLRIGGKGQKGRDEWVFDVWKKKTGSETVKLYGGKVLENISQALAGELCKQVLVQFGDKCVGQVHDELHLLEKTGLAHITAGKLKAAMETAPSWLPEIRLEAEVHIGTNWGCK